MGIRPSISVVMDRWSCSARNCSAVQDFGARLSGHTVLHASLQFSENFVSYIITGADSAGAVSPKRDPAAAAIKKAVELVADGCGDVWPSTNSVRRGQDARPSMPPQDGNIASSAPRRPPRSPGKFATKSPQHRSSCWARSRRERCYVAADRGNDTNCPPKRKLSR